MPAASAAAESSKAGTAYAPVREAASKLGVEVRWDQAARTVTLVKGGQTLVLTPGKAQGVFNGKAVNVGGPVQLVSGKTLVPAGFLTGIFGQPATPGKVPTRKLPKTQPICS